MERIIIALAVVLLTVGSVSAEYARIRKIGVSQSTGGVGQPVTITVTTEGAGLQYKFWANTADFNTDPNNPSWVLLHDWTISNSCTWTPAATGLHTIVVWVSGNTSALGYNIIGSGYNVTQGVQPPPQTYESDKLFGYWHFWYAIITTWDEYYDLNKREDLNEQGDYYVSGTDQWGDIVLATYFPDDATFVLLDPSVLFDKFYSFRLNAAGSNITSGTYCQVDPDTNEIISDLYPLSGIKVHGNPPRVLPEMNRLTAERLQVLEDEETKRSGDVSSHSILELDKAGLISKYFRLKEAMK